MSPALFFWLAVVRRGAHLALACTFGCQAAPPRAPLLPPGSAYGCTAQELRAPPMAMLEGKATYYADSLAGNKTASGAVYRPEELTAAHRTLAFGARVLVQRTDVAAPVVCVTITDRGPFAGKERIIDLSRAAAETVQMMRAGVVPVRVFVLPAR